MFDTRSAENRKIERELEVRYSIDEIEVSDSAEYYKVTRTAMKTYRYVDMSMRGAADTAGYLRNLYTRTTAALAPLESGQSVPSAVYYPERLTAVEIQRSHGNSYDVAVTVSEKDVRASSTNPSDPSSLFSSENARDYDGESVRSSMDITSVTAA